MIIFQVFFLILRFSKLHDPIGFNFLVNRGWQNKYLMAKRRKKLELPFSDGTCV
jgi:hypothetical protein